MIFKGSPALGLDKLPLPLCLIIILLVAAFAGAASRWVLVPWCVRVIKKGEKIPWYRMWIVLLLPAPCVEGEDGAQLVRCDGGGAADEDVEEEEVCGYGGMEEGRGVGGGDEGLNGGADGDGKCGLERGEGDDPRVAEVGDRGDSLGVAEEKVGKGREGEGGRDDSGAVRENVRESLLHGLLSKVGCRQPHKPTNPKP